MLLKEIREAYDRHLADPTSDPLFKKLRSDAQEERYRRVRMVRDLADRAIPFVIEPSAIDLIATVHSSVKLVEHLGPLLLEAPLPFESVWMEFDEHVSGTRIKSGVLMQKVGDRILVCSFHRSAGEPVIEPLLFLTVAADGKLDMTADPFTSARFIEGHDGSQDERVSQFFGEAFPQTGWAILNAVKAIHLIAAKAGPLDADEEPMFSRPERRRMMREGAVAVGTPPTVTKVRVNAQGRLHLQAVDDEEGGAGGARRRAHRVRGHYMRTAKGSSWRTAHLRGLGKVNETVRVIEASVQDPPSEEGSNDVNSRPSP